MARVRLEIVAGERKGSSFSFDRYGSFVCGRASDCQCKILGDPKISRHHFRIETNPPISHILDLNSSNGTYVNGEKITSRTLRHGDSVSVGSVHFQYVVEDVQPEETRDWVPRTSTMVSPVVDSQTDARVIGGYEIGRELGRGNMGIVYSATHCTSRKTVALKVVIPEMASSIKPMQLFLREANLLCQFDHPRIVKFIDMGMFQEHLFIVMEHIDKIDFMAKLNSFDLDERIRVACGVTRFVLEGLEYVHRNNVVHRDVKPSNILVSQKDRKISAKLADFGLAKNYQNAGFSGITQANEAKGTLACMPPEQIIDSCGSKPSCDIYAVGATLYYYLTGCFPHQQSRDTIPTLAEILDSAPVHLCERNPEIPVELGAIVMRSLRRAPDERHSSAGHFRSELQSNFS